MPLCTDKEVVIDTAVAVEESNVRKVYLFSSDLITVIRLDPNDRTKDSIENSSKIVDYFNLNPDFKTNLENRSVKAAYTQEDGSKLILETVFDNSSNQRVRILT